MGELYDIGSIARNEKEALCDQSNECKAQRRDEGFN